MEDQVALDALLNSFRQYPINLLKTKTETFMHHGSWNMLFFTSLEIEPF